MWNSAAQRSRAASHAKKKDRERRRVPVHFKRISARLESIQNTDLTPLPAVRLLLNDLSPVGIGLFASSLLVAGQELYLVFSNPIEVKFKAKVIWCQENVEAGHVLSKQPYTFRAGLEFIHNPEEAKKAQAICDEIQKTHLASAS